MYTDVSPGTDIDVLNDALFQGAIARFAGLPEMSAVVVSTQAT
jgi:hypothetical protein